MRKLILLLVCLFASLVGCDPAPTAKNDIVADEMAKFQGVWKVVSRIKKDTKYLTVQLDQVPTIFFDGTITPGPTGSSRERS
jgi:hypothetical protein